MKRRSFVFGRREFLKKSASLAVGVATGQAGRRKAATAPRAMLDPASLEEFVDPLPIPPVLRPQGTRAHPEHRGSSVSYYRVAMREFTAKIHRDLPLCRMWGYGGSSPGPTLETRSGQPVFVEWANELPKDHFLPIDHNVHGAEADKPAVRVVTHLHGGRVPANSDGYPEDWYVPGKSATYFYPNEQDAAQLWYHDHALGITRLNVYAGLFGNFMVRDELEESLNLPRAKCEIALVLCDRMFDRSGQLYYPVSPDPQSPWVSELFGDAILVNGKLFPFLEVEPRKYRFRVLNAANARFFRLALSDNAEFHQIGTDMGFLPAPLALKTLSIAPAERADVIIDFSAHSGERLALTNDGKAIMEFRVGKKGAQDTSALPSALRPVPKIPESVASATRILTLGEKDDRASNPLMMLLNNARWHAPITEQPKLDSVEVWNLLNFTDDSHPIHLHGVRFQILDRRSFEPEYYYKGGRIEYIGAPVPPADTEAGWKDTAQAHPGMATRIITRFDGYAGKYVWHCHILEHEDNEMMRPYEIVRS